MVDEIEINEEKGIFICPACDGTGEEIGMYNGRHEIRECLFCQGTGRFVVPMSIMEKIKQNVIKDIEKRTKL